VAKVRCTVAWPAPLPRTPPAGAMTSGTMSLSRT
jgi:hypothetical protein